MASAAFHFAAQGSLLKYAGTAGGTVTATLDSVNGVDYAVWTLEGTDETSDGEWSLSTSTGTSTVVTLPATGTGKAAVLRCTVNGDPDITATAKVYIAPEVGAVGEKSESDANYGQAAFINPMLRSLGGFTSATALATPSTLAARDGSGNSAFVGLTASTLTSTANLTLAAAAAGYVSVFENATEIARVQDTGGRRVVQLQGTGDFSSTGSMRLDSAGGTSLYEDGVEVCTATEAAGVASLAAPAATAFRLAATTASAAVRIACGAGGTVQILENATDVLHLDDDAGVARLSGRGASGTRLEANAGNLTIRSASGSVVAIQEGTTSVAELRDDAGVAELRLKGGSANRLTADNAIVIQPASGYYTQINDGTGAELMTLVSNYIRLPTNAPTGAIPGGYAALGFNGTDLILRVGSTNYTIQKV